LRSLHASRQTRLQRNIEVGYVALDLVGDRNRCCFDDIGNEERGRLDFLGAEAALAIER